MPIVILPITSTSTAFRGQLSRPTTAHNERAATMYEYVQQVLYGHLDLQCGAVTDLASKFLG